MINQLTVLLPHFLMALAIWRLLHRDDLDEDPALPPTHRQARHTRRRAQRPEAPARPAPAGKRPRA